MLRAQAPGILSTLPLQHAAAGWDCDVWRLGADLAVRLPRRASSAPLIEHERRALAQVAAAIEATDVRVPLPLMVGRPDLGYPWSWSIVPWFHGESAITTPRSARVAWGAPLASALGALHRKAPTDAPNNPFRGVPLADRDSAITMRFASLRERGLPDAERLDQAEQFWHTAVETDPWREAPVWIHGDVHPGNLIARDDQLVAIIDFGDVTSGDPAYDLATAWLTFDHAGRSAFVTACGERYDRTTWIRARGWAAAFAATLLELSDDNPAYAALGLDTLRELGAAD